MRVLVCGGRDFDDFDLLHETLKPYMNNIELLIHGGARGADKLAADWAFHNDIQSVCYHADWDQYGKAAGPIRNQQMLEEGKPDFVIAFPGGKGTADMVHRARKRGVPVREIA